LRAGITRSVNRAERGASPQRKCLLIS
jgi:hypothetical protein